MIVRVIAFYTNSTRVSSASLRSVPFFSKDPTSLRDSVIHVDWQTKGTREETMEGKDVGCGRSRNAGRIIWRDWAS